MNEKMDHVLMKTLLVESIGEGDYLGTLFTHVRTLVIFLVILFVASSKLGASSDRKWTVVPRTKLTRRLWRRIRRRLWRGRLHQRAKLSCESAEALASFLELPYVQLNRTRGRGGTLFFCTPIMPQPEAEKVWTEDDADVIAEIWTRMKVHVKSLTLSGCDVDSNVCEVLFPVLCEFCECLRLGGPHFKLPLRSIRALIMSTRSPASSLDLINLSDRWLGDSGAIELSEALKEGQTSVRKLILDRCGIGPRGAVALSKLFDRRDNKDAGPIRYLWLAGNRVEDEGAFGLANALRGSCAELLSLADNDLDDSAASMLASSVAHAPHLRLLDLSGNSGITDDSLPDFLIGIQRHPSLRVLALSGVSTRTRNELSAQLTRNNSPNVKLVAKLLAIAQRQRRTKNTGIGVLPDELIRALWEMLVCSPTI